MPTQKLLPLLTVICGGLLLPVSPASADALSNDHPTVALVNTYFRHVVDEDWAAAAEMLNPTSIQRKQQRAIDLVKRAPTISAETEMLSSLGVKDIRELETMTPAQFYAAERNGLSKRDDRTDTIRKQKQESLKVNVLGVIGEKAKDNKVVHLAVRTSQSVLDKTIDELIFISFQQDEKDSKKWFIVPDMQAPVTTEKAATEGAKK